MIRNFREGGGVRDFMRVRVVVNITKSLCRGRKVTFSQNLTFGFRSSIRSCQIVAFGVVGLTIETRNAIYG